MKHIKIEVKDSGEWGKLLRIVEQTHRNNELGERDNNFEFEGFYLSSHSYPAQTNNGLYTRGYDSNLDNNIVEVPSEQWLSRLRKTVRAYNEKFKDEGKETSSEPDVEVIE